MNFLFDCSSVDKWDTIYHLTQQQTNLRQLQVKIFAYILVLYAVTEIKFFNWHWKKKIQLIDIS